MRGAVLGGSRRGSEAGISRGLGGPALCLLLASGIGCRPGPATPALGPQGQNCPFASAELRAAELALTAGHFFHAVVEQRGIDVRVTFHDPQGQPLADIDSPNGAWGPEEVILILPATGTYHLDVKGPSKEGVKGEVAWSVLADREPTARDRELVAAEGVYRAGLAARGAGRLDESLDSLRRAHELFRTLGLPRRLAEVDQGFYRTYLETGDRELAASFAERAAELFEAEGNLRMAARLAREGGGLRVGLGQLRPGAERLTQAVALSRAIPDPGGEVLSLGLLGAAHTGLGELQLSLTSFERAFEVLRSQPDESNEAILLSDYAALLLDLNQPSAAARAYERAAEIDRRQGRADLLAIALRGLAEARALGGERGAVAASMDEALRLERVAPEGRSLAVALHASGRIRHLVGDLAGAEEALREALAHTADHPDAKTEASVLLDLGYLLQRSGRLDEALALEERAQATFETIEDEKGRASAVVRGAQVLSELGRPREAWGRLEPALSVIERLRAATSRRDYRASYFAHWQSYYELAIETLARCHEREPRSGYDRLAWTVHERRLARELEAARRDPSALWPPALRARERDLEAKLSEAALSPSAEARAERVEELLAELHRLRGTIQEDREGPSESLPTKRAGHLLEAVQRELASPETLLLVFASGETRSFLWAISHEALTLHSLPARGQIEPLVRNFLSKLRERRNSSRDIETQLGRRLSDLLLAPVAPLLRGQRLLLVADGALQELPWAALPLPGSTGEGRALVSAQELAVLPAARVLLDLRRPAHRRSAPARALAVFADPVFSPADPRVSSGSRQEVMQPSGSEPIAATRELLRSAANLGIDPEARLPETQAEAATILKLAPPGTHLLASGFEATRTALLEAPLERFRVLHLATHALLDRAEPELSGIVLSRLDAEGRAIDGFVRAFEISRLRLPGSLVVLSACESGVGKDLKGEGMQSLLRAFFEAGASGVVASLWPVSDRSTAELMRHFYRGFLHDGLPAAEALRRAQLALAEQPDTADPYHWAGFYYQGDRQVW